MIANALSIAVYLRISTNSQQSDGQRLDVTRWLESHGIDPDAVTWYEDTDSRETLNRAALKQLQSAVFQGRIRTIVVADVTRLAGSIVDGVNLLHGWLSQGVRLVSVRQEFDFASTTGMMVAQPAIRAQPERDGNSPPATAPESKPPSCEVSTPAGSWGRRRPNRIAPKNCGQAA